MELEETHFFPFTLIKKVLHSYMRQDENLRVGLYTSLAGLVVVKDNPFTEHIHHIKLKNLILNLICVIHLI